MRRKYPTCKCGGKMDRDYKKNGITWRCPRCGYTLVEPPISCYKIPEDGGTVYDRT